MRSLDKVFVSCRANNQPWPKELLGFALCSFSFCISSCNVFSRVFLTSELVRFWLQSDNTVKEVRNTYAARIVSSLTQAGVWSTSSQNFLGVGHTHEDVDGILSLCKAALDSATVLLTPQDVIARLKMKLAPVFEARHLGFDVELVQTVAWQSSS